MFSKAVLSSFVIAMLVLTACQKAEMPVPTEQDGAQVWHDLLKNDHGIELVSFKKTNGRMDGSHYLLDFEAQVRYLDNGIHDPAAAPGVGIRANRKGTVETCEGILRIPKNGEWLERPRWQRLRI